MTTAGDVIENALYLSLNDRENNTVDPSDVAKHIPTLNKVLAGLSKRNPAFTALTFSSGSLQKDPDLNLSYIEMSGKKFMTLFRVEFVYSGGSLVVPLKRMGLNKFFSLASSRSATSLPAYYQYNVFSNRIYLYPTGGTAGNFNVFGKERIGKDSGGVFADETDTFPEYTSETFIAYLEHFLAKYICNQYNAPWQASKEELLKELREMVDSENNISYQDIVSEDMIPVPQYRLLGGFL